MLGLVVALVVNVPLLALSSAPSCHLFAGKMVRANPIAGLRQSSLDVRMHLSDTATMCRSARGLCPVGLANSRTRVGAVLPVVAS